MRMSKILNVRILVIIMNVSRKISGTFRNDGKFINFIIFTKNILSY